MTPKRNHGLGSVGYLDAGAEYTDEQRAFLLAMDRYKRENRRPHPTWAEVLAVARSLGYRKSGKPLLFP